LAQSRYRGERSNDMVEQSGDRDRIAGTVDEVKGKGKQAWGAMTDDERLKAEGRLDEAKGKAEQFIGGVKDKIDDVRDDVADRVKP
jgi:uncharacterized protein YjbJ (UPF0337 family)